MPAYQNSPLQTPKLVMKGVATYLFGKFSQLVGNSRFALTSVAIASNVATVGVQQIDGPLPNVGDYISIENSVTGTGEFNVNRATITGVTINSSTGIGTITFALTGTNVSTTTDGGTVVTEPAEVGEALVNGSSIPCVFQAPEGDSQFTVPVVVKFPSLPTAATIHLQAALKNIDSEYTNVDSTGIAIVAGGVQTVGPFGQVTLQRGYCYRLNVSGVSGGTNPTIIGKIGG